VVVLDATVSSDDISSLVRFDGDKIGVMWSDTTAAPQMRFRFHSDADPVGVWSSVESVIGDPNPNFADDHINLKADSTGRVYAVTKTKFSSASRPGTMLHRRSDSGAWSSHTVSNASLDRTRPIVLLDEPHNAIRVFEASGAGTVFMKKSRLAAISFSTASAGTVVIRDTGSAVANPTSTKQNITNLTRLIVLATNHGTKRYWHAYQQIVPCIDGTAGDNLIIGTNADDVLCGRGGNDVLRGLLGNDRLSGGPGADQLVGGGGTDRLAGDSGNDRLFARDGRRDVVQGGAGHDGADVDRRDRRLSIEFLL